MNTINSVRPYMALRNNPETSTTQPQQPQALAFKGQLGRQVVEEISIKKDVTAASILALVGGVFGLSKDKVSDVMEELVGKINSLMSNNEELKQQNNELKIDLTRAKNANTDLQNDLERTRTWLRENSQEDANIIAEKDAEIDKLQKYKAMAEVKSVDELDVVSPEEFIQLLNESKEALPKAKESLLTYLFKGTGQEEFLKHMERNNKILKAKRAGITKMEEMNEAYNKAGSYIGSEPESLVPGLMEEILTYNEVGAQISYPPIRAQVEKNADALINPMMNPNYRRTSNKEVLEKVSKFYEELAIQTEKFEIKNNCKFESRNLDCKGRPYYTFTKNVGGKMDIYLDLLEKGLWYSRITYPDGRVEDNYGYKL